MQMTPIVSPHLPSVPSAPSGIAVGAPIRVAGAQAQMALGCPPGMGCGPQETETQLQGVMQPSTWPTWVKMLAGLTVLGLIIAITAKLARR